MISIYARLGCVLGLCMAMITPALAASADQRFHDLYTREWQWRQQQFAGADDEDSQGQPADHLPKVDAATQAMRERYWADVLKQLDAIPESRLTGENPVNYEVYRQQIEVLLNDQKFQTWQMPFNSDSAFWSELDDGVVDLVLRRELLHVDGIQPGHHLAPVVEPLLLAGGVHVVQAAVVGLRFAGGADAGRLPEIPR